MKRKAIEVAKAKNLPLPFSLAIETGNIVYLSGQPSMNLEDGKFIDGDFSQQFKQCLANLDEVLKEANLTRDNVIKCNVYLKDINDYKVMNGLYTEAFISPRPARTCIQAGALPMGAIVEIEYIACKE